MNAENGTVSSEVAVAKPANLDVVQVAEHFVKSGWFKDSGDQSKAVVKILAGQEMGLGPMASMQGVHIIDGKPSMSANLLGAQVKRSGRYNYRVVEHTAEKCLIDFYERGEKVGHSSFTLADAQQAGVAGKAVWKKYPKAMLFARAMSQGVRTHCPDVTAGPAYVPEELGAAINESGDPVPIEQPAEQDTTIEAEEVDGTVTISSERAKELGLKAKAGGLNGEAVKKWLAENAQVDRISKLTEPQAQKLERDVEAFATENQPGPRTDDTAPQDAAEQPDTPPEGPVEAKIGQERAAKLAEGFGRLGLSSGKIKQLIGGVGGQAPTELTADLALEALANLTRQQADALQARLDTMADAG